MNGIQAWRERRGLTLVDLSGQLGISKTALAKLERGWDPLPVPIVKDLAVLFECGAGEVTGIPIPVEDWQRSPYAAGAATAEELEPYGNFGFEVGSKEFSFPVNLATRKALLRQLGRRSPQALDNDEDAWITCGTLNNRLLLINPRALRHAWLRSDDDEATEYFAHPEVYREADNLDHCSPGYDLGPILQQALDEHVARVGEMEAVKEAERILLFGLDGAETDDELYATDEAVITSMFALEANSFAVPQHSLLLVDAEGWHRNEFVNLSHVSFVQVPLERYLRRGAPEELADNDQDAISPAPVDAE